MNPKPEPFDFQPAVAPGHSQNTVVLYVYRDSAGALTADSLALIERMKMLLDDTSAVIELNYVAPASVDSPLV